MDLVRIIRNDVFTDSKVIAEGANVTHRKIKTAIRNHVSDLESFGKLSAPYRAESTGGRPEECYRLNEQQATFLITLLKNRAAGTRNGITPACQSLRIKRQALPIGSLRPWNSWERLH